MGSLVGGRNYLLSEISFLYTYYTLILAQIEALNWVLQSLGAIIQRPDFSILSYLSYFKRLLLKKSSM